MVTLPSHARSLPDLGKRGEGWIAIQTALIVVVLGSGLATGPDWSGIVLGATVMIGAALLAAGVAMFVRGAIDLGRGFSIWMAPVADHPVEHGLYRHVRHPICGGQVLIAFGWALFQASWVTLVAAVVYAGLVALKVRHEETMIERVLPGYAAYRTRVRHVWIPRLV